MRSTCEKSVAGALAGGILVVELEVNGLGVRDCCFIRTPAESGGERVEVARPKRLVESARVLSTEERLGGSLDLVRLTGRMLVVEASDTAEEGGLVAEDNGGRDKGGLIVELLGLPTGE